MPSSFQEKVYARLKTVPRGRVTTYGELARSVGCASAQAVGQALKRNPFAPDVPCHRVIASDLSLGGFRGQRCGTVLEEKRLLLEKEGVSFRANRLIDPHCVVRFLQGHWE